MARSNAFDNKYVYGTFVFLLIAIAVGGLVYLGSYTGFVGYMLNGSAGMIYHIGIEQEETAEIWAGLNGILTLDLFHDLDTNIVNLSGGDVKNYNPVLDCLGSSGNDLYISETWYQLIEYPVSAATIADVEAYVNASLEGVSAHQSPNNTYLNTTTVNLGGDNISTIATYTKQKNLPNGTDFNAWVLKDAAGNLLFGTDINTLAIGYDGGLYNFQTMIPIPYGSINRTYYIYGDPITDPFGNCTAVFLVKVFGMVTDETTGAPLENVIVNISGEFTTTSDAAGNYSIYAREGNNLFIGTLDNYQQYTDIISLTANQPLNYNFSMTQTTAEIQGVVTDANTNQTIADATVQVGTAITSTTINGTYQLFTTPGNQSIIVYKSEYDIYLDTVTLVPGNVTYRNASLQPQYGFITGYAKHNVTLEPLPNVTVSAYGSTNFTDENGNFTIRVYRGTHNFVGVKAGYGTYVANLTVSGGYYTTHNFTLQPISAAYDNGTISGYVTNNLTGDPLENVTIYLDTKQATTGTLGNYSMTDITYGDHTFYAIKQGFETYVGNLSMPAMGNITFNFTLDPFYGEFRRNGTLKGAVYDAKTGIGLANATIDALIYNTTTNSSGEYEFSLPAQDYLILAHKDGYNDLVRKTTITESNTSTLTFFLSNITGLVQEQELILNLSANIPTLVNFSGNFSLVMYITATENIIDAKIDLRKYTENPATTPIPDFSLVGNYLEISTNINTSTISSVTYVFTYNESLIPAPYNESSVGLYLFVENSSSWDTQTILRDETQNTLSYTTDHFSIYVPGMIRPMIQGIVTDAETNDLLSNVTVSIAGLITSTNATGNYFLEFSAGTHYLIAFKDGYESSVNLSTYNESYNYTTNIALTPIKIDQAPAVVIQQQQSSQRQRPPTTQQPRQMVVEEAKVDYYISPSEIKQKLRLGSFAEKTVSVYNFMQRDMELVLDVAGDVAPYISLSTTTVVVPKLSRGEFVVRLLGNDLGNFDGTLTFSRAFDYEMPITLNVTDQEVEVNALMLRTDVMKKEVRKGKKLRYKVDLRNLLTDQEYDVRLNFTIQDINRTVLAILAPQETRLKTFTTLLGEYDIPKDFETGEYILNVEANYFDFTSSASALFEVTTSPLQYKLFGAIPVWVVLLLIVLGAVGYLAFVIIKKKQEAAKRFHVQVDYDTLPPKGPRNIFVGKVAETTKMTYFDMDKLTVHSIVAGSTGGGKSISAQVVIEECLLKGVAVIIFDPTAQWTGMLRKCVDKHFLSLYPEFGMKPTDARAFPGNIKVIKDYREKIDVFSFAKPGEVWVVTVNRLPAKDYDKFVEATIKQVFRSNLKEKRQLEYLFVFDEIHRILPKFGGSGGGFIQIERCCREFRKWGIGIILVSQVLADFVGQIKANINTEIQMKTRDEEDMERIRMKYGEQYVQGSIKAPVGSGMVQNSAWNNGKPYFVQFRPIMHSVERLTDDELELYAKYNDIVWDLEYGLKQLEEMGQDVFDLKLELKLASDKIKSGNFNMVKIYLEGLTPRIDAFWKKIGKTPKKREIELYTDEGEVKKPEEKPAEPAANSPPGANPPEKKEWDILVLQAEEALKKGDKATAQGCYQKIFELYKNAPADAKNDIYQKANALKAKLG